MRTRWRRWWPVAALAVAAIAVASAYPLIDLFTREPPNYSKVEAGLYIGGSVPQPPPGTTATLNLCENEDPYRSEVHAWHAIRDAEPAPTLDWLREQVEFVAAQRAAGRTVYVHCFAGVSRSGMVVVAYFMARNGWSRDAAMEHVRAKRPQLRPNPAFMQLLLNWERALKGEPAG